MTALNRKLSTTAALLLCVVLFVGITLLSSAILRGWRVDLTSTGQYTLAPGTRDILKQLDEPVTLYLFFGERASENIPALRSYADTVRELLQEMEQREKEVILGRGRAGFADVCHVRLLRLDGRYEVAPRMGFQRQAGVVHWLLRWRRVQQVRHSSGWNRSARVEQA